MNWLKRLFGKRKSAAEEENTPTSAAPATDSAPAAAEKSAPSTAEPAPEAAATAAADTGAATNTETAATEDAAETGTQAAAASTSEPSASEPVAAEPEPAPAADVPDEATDPALSQLDDVERSAELQTAEVTTQPVQEGPYGPASAKPASDGTAPSAEFTIKGKESSKLFHTEESPYFGRTKADVWFKSAADAESAGFTAYTRKKATAKK